MREYEVVINGAETTVQLSDEDAKRIGAVPTTRKSEPVTKKRDPANKSGGSGGRKRSGQPRLSG
ncbi:hypothetical protein ACFYE2_00500 [Kocuria sp. CPCC 205300]|uniref:hypothetical protein n=1 Tax=Kocuria sabuli TaxID=3071448 RepID=UPI0036D94EFF